jgi:hypothetical protein
MVMDKLIPILIQLVGGAAGGNVVAALMKNFDVNKLVATVTGIIGGIGGGQLASLTGLLENIFGSSSGAMGNIVGNGGASAIGGALLTAIVAFVKKSMNKSAA